MFIPVPVLCIGVVVVLLAAVGAYHLGLSLVVGARSLAKSKPEPEVYERIPEPVSPAPWADITAYHTLVEPPPWHEDTSWDAGRFGDPGWVGEQTGTLPVIDLDKPDAAEAEPGPRERDWSPAPPPKQLEISASYGDYPTICGVVTVGGRP